MSGFENMNGPPTTKRPFAPNQGSSAIPPTASRDEIRREILETATALLASGAQGMTPERAARDAATLWKAANSEARSIDQGQRGRNCGALAGMPGDDHR